MSFSCDISSSTVHDPLQGSMIFMNVSTFNSSATFNFWKLRMEASDFMIQHARTCNAATVIFVDHVFTVKETARTSTWFGEQECRVCLWALKSAPSVIYPPFPLIFSIRNFRLCTLSISETSLNRSSRGKSLSSQ